jgi:hypothetical protein
MQAFDPLTEEASFLALIDELQYASTEAGNDGFYRMARVLDDCGVSLAAEVDGTRDYQRRSVERAQRSLAMWKALRAW